MKQKTIDNLPKLKSQRHGFFLLHEKSDKKLQPELGDSATEIKDTSSSGFEPYSTGWDQPDSPTEYALPKPSFRPGGYSDST